MWTKADIERNQVAILGGCLLVGLVLTAMIIGNSLIGMKRYDQETISVTGAASREIDSDSASWSGYFGRQSDNLNSAYDALKQDAKVVRDFLLAHGVKPEEITMSSVETQSLYRQLSNGSSTNAIEGYKLTQTVQVASKDINQIESIARDISELIARDIALTSNAPQFFYTKLDDLKVEMLGKATENAKERARSMAASTGNGIGLMRSAQMGVFQITPPNSTDVSDSGISDTSSKRKRVTAVVNVSLKFASTF